MKSRLFVLYQILVLWILCITFVVYVHHLSEIPKKGYATLENISVISPHNLIVNSENLSVTENLEEIEKLYPNVPFQFLRDQNYSKGRSCKTFEPQKDIIYKDENHTSFFGITLKNPP